MGTRNLPFLYNASSLMGRGLRRAESQVGLVDVDESMRSIIRKVEPYTLTPNERVASLGTAVDYIIDQDIPGAFVECGLWRGGSLMSILLRLHQRGITDRDIYGFDTFAGMTEATPEDVDFHDRPVGSRVWERVNALSLATINGLAKITKSNVAVGVSRDEVFALLATTGYPTERIHLVEGPVEDTVPANAPETIALLRLDTDFYVSTRHELEHLYPRVPIGGVLIIDDYGRYKGARKAADEYFDGHRVLLQRVDYTCRLAVKQQER